LKKNLDIIEVQLHEKKLFFLEQINKSYSNLKKATVKKYKQNIVKYKKYSLKLDEDKVLNEISIKKKKF